jgi:hypothetical protein
MKLERFWSRFGEAQDHPTPASELTELKWSRFVEAQDHPTPASELTELKWSRFGEAQDHPTPASELTELKCQNSSAAAAFCPQTISSMRRFRGSHTHTSCSIFSLFLALVFVVQITENPVSQRLVILTLKPFSH